MIFPGTPGRFSDYDRAMRSNVGKGPKGDGIIADVVRDDPYGVYRVQFKNSRTGEVYLTTPNMDPGSRIYFCSLTLQYQSSEDVDVSYTVPLYAFSTQQVGTIRDARVGDMVFYKLRREGMLGANAIGIGIITNLSLDGNVTFMQHSVLDIENIDEIDAQVRRLQEDADNIETALDTVQSTLDDLPSYDEFLSLSENVRQNETDITTKIPWPVTPYSKYGTNGQVLRTNGDGSTQWQAPLIPTDQQAETYIGAWLTEHPEATTTVQDNSITDKKLVQSGGVLTDVLAISKMLKAPIDVIANGSVNRSSSPYRISRDFTLVAGNEYRFSCEINVSSTSIIIIYIYDDNNTLLSSANIQPGSTSAVKTFSAQTTTNAHMTLYDSNTQLNINYTASIMSLDSSTELDNIYAEIESVNDEIESVNDEIDSVNNDITNIKEILQYPTSVNIEGTIQKSNTIYQISSKFTLYENVEYIYDVSRSVGSDRELVAYIKNSVGDTLSSATISSGNTHVQKRYTPTETVEVYLSLYDSNDPNLYDYTIALSNSSGNQNVIDRLYGLKESPIETLPQYVVNTLARHNVGSFRRGYICLSCDDGTIGLQQYTIPMLMSKNVPCTFGLWASSSEPGVTPAYQPSVILQTAEGRSLLLSAINSGCTVAQHGNINWTDMTEVELRDFFQKERQIFAGYGITVKGAICPSHCINNRVRAIVGGTFGSVRSGYKGFLSSYDQAHGIPGDVPIQYPYYLTGDKSNAYGYTSYNVIDTDKNIDWLKTAVDNAIAQRYCMIVYWHDWNFIEEDSNYIANREKLEALIDYAKSKDIVFCTLDEIPDLK